MTATTEHLSPDTLPADPRELDANDYALLEDYHVNVWPGMNAGARVRLLERLRREEAKRTRANEARERKTRLAGDYVAALCGLPKKSEPGYAAAWADLMEKKAAYIAAGGKV